MVYQVDAGYSILGRKIKVPQLFIPRVIRAIILAFTPDEESILNTIHCVSAASPVTDADVAAVAPIIADWVENTYAPLVSAGVTFGAVHVRSMEGLEVPQTTLPLLALTGGLSGDMLPAATAYAVELTSGRTMRRNRGMFYAFPTSESQNAGTGGPASTYVTNILGAVDGLRTDLVVGGYPMVVAQFETQTFRTITGTTGKQRWGSQDRRQAGNN